MVGLIPGLLFFIIFDSTRNLFNSIKKFEIPNYLVVFTYFLHIVWAYYFMVKENLRMEGFGIARSVTEGLNAILIICMVIFLKKWGNQNDEIQKLNFSGFSKKSFKNLGSQLAIAIPMGSILYLDWVAAGKKIIFFMEKFLFFDKIFKFLDMQTFFVASIKDKD